MIRIEKIAIKEFRGIRDLELVMGGQNFAACGPNGTGKSGIVDAIEFALTGSISRLSGEGTGDLSVKQHGPHVDFRNKPEQSMVTLDVRSEEHTSELQSLMRISYAVFCLKKKTHNHKPDNRQKHVHST